jgi:hypothetical protein
MLSQNNLIGQFNMTNSRFDLSFNIKPMLTSGGWSNIFHFTNNNADSSRMPAMWFHPGTFGLHLRFDGPGYGNRGFNGNEIVLPQGVWTSLSISLVGNVVNVTTNGTSLHTVTLPGPVNSGLANFYMANPWYAPANAWVSDVVLNNVPVIFAQPTICPSGTIGDVNNCGFCGTKCGANQKCGTNGSCVCAAGTLGDANNCGSCGNSCGANARCNVASGTHRCQPVALPATCNVTARNVFTSVLLQDQTGTATFSDANFYGLVSY